MCVSVWVSLLWSLTFNQTCFQLYSFKPCTGRWPHVSVCTCSSMWRNPLDSGHFFYNKTNILYSVVWMWLSYQNWDHHTRIQFRRWGWLFFFLLWKLVARMRGMWACESWLDKLCQPCSSSSRQAKSFGIAAELNIGTEFCVALWTPFYAYCLSLFWIDNSMSNTRKEKDSQMRWDET